jgi:hypothetical protein
MGNSELIDKSIVEFMVKNNIKPQGLEISSNCTGYKITSGNLDSKLYNKFSAFLKTRFELDELFTMIMKEKYNTWAKMEKQIKKKHIHQKVKRWIKNSKELLELFDCDIYIKSK